MHLYRTVLPALLAAACTAGPTNNAVISGSGVVNLTGYVPGVNVPLQFQVLDQRVGVWRNWGSVFNSAAQTEHTDCAGASWARWENSLLQPTASSLLAPSTIPNRNVLNIRTLFAGTDTALATFENNYGDCMSAYCSGADAINNCKSPESPTLTVHTPCGARDQVCCHSGIDRCDPGLICDANFKCATNNWLTWDQYQHLGDDPFDVEADWTEECQGVANDGRSWYVTQGGNVNRMWKVWDVDFNDDFSGYPRTTSNLGCGHWGDPDYSNGRVYVPLEKCGGAGNQIAVFNSSDLSLIGMQPTFTSSASFVAVNPIDNKIYMTPVSDDATTLNVYSQSFVGGRFTMTFERAIPFREIVNGQFRNATVHKRTQGGAFAPSGKLYLTVDEPDAGHGKIVGVQVSPNMAFIQWERHVQVDYNEWPTHGEEIEGITVVPTGKWGQIHIIVLDNEIDSDNVFFKHVKINDQSRL